MSIKVSPCQLSDVPEMVEVMRTAFGTQPHRAVMYRGVSPEEEIAKLHDRYKRLITQQSDPFYPERKIMKATDPNSGEIMALAIWTYQPHGYRPETDFLAAVPDKPEPRNGERESKGNWEMMRDWAVKTAEMRSEHPKSRGPHYLLDQLCTSPNHERKGAASNLLRSGLPEVDDKACPCFVAATVIGHPVYERFGFSDVGELSLDPEKYEPGCGIGVVTWKSMIREPHAL